MTNKKSGTSLSAYVPFYEHKIFIAYILVPSYNSQALALGLTFLYFFDVGTSITQISKLTSSMTFLKNTAKKMVIKQDILEDGVEATL
jgi:ABC-type nickel/cobalt efflux system permease component RcnA